MNQIKNRVQLIGHLGSTPDVRETESGKKLAKFSLATNQSYRNANGDKVTETTWHQLIAWGAVADIASKYLNKGSEVAIEGRLINRSYTDKEGVKRFISEVQVNEMLLLGTKAASKTEEQLPALD
ncbi:MAG: single-stranded DNA-binding protein [Chitinophagaceae bacterium]|nr:single-stranded DNA-binding protein [Chitinophagaceae bacterium]